MLCWKCGKDQEDPPMGKLPFRATCDHCHSWLHCCVNCTNYAPGLANSCKIPGTEYIADREGCNFCEEFVLKGKKGESGTDPNAAAKKLFGDDAEDKKKRSFDDLF